jgi:arylsulfatase A-like enzyme
MMLPKPLAALGSHNSSAAPDHPGILSYMGSAVEATRVPLIVNWPGVTKPARVCRDLVDFTDLLPRFAEGDGRFYDLERDPAENRPIKLGTGGTEAARSKLQSVLERYDNRELWQAHRDFEQSRYVYE